MALRCPACNVDLHPVAGRTGNAAICGGCGGTWLDRAAADSLMQNLLDQTVKRAASQGDARALVNEANRRKSGFPPPLTRAEGQRACAECGRQLTVTRFDPAKLLLEVCASHGTWFDAGELRTMTQHFEMRAATSDADSVAFKAEITTLRHDDSSDDLSGAAELMGFIGRRR